MASLTAKREEALRREASGWARRFYGLPEGEVDDAVQTAYLNLLERERKHPGQVRDLKGALSWEVSNSWRMELRRRGRRPSVPLEECPESIHPVSDPAAQAEATEAARTLFELVGSMPQRRRQVLLLRDAWGLSPQDVCRQLGISRRTYREEHARGLKELFAKLAELENGGWCKGHRDAIVAVAAGRASEDQALQAKRHVGNCLDCRHRLATLRVAANRKLDPLPATSAGAA